MFTVISTSLNATSRSRLMGQYAYQAFLTRGEPSQYLELAQDPLPMCDGDDSYRHPNVARYSDAIANSMAILVATPVYNYDVSAATKNLIELTGRAWSGRVVGFLAAAGGSGSYMSVMGIANSLMLDFRSMILPKFVYATGSCFSETQIEDHTIIERIDRLVHDAVRVGKALNGDPSP